MTSSGTRALRALQVVNAAPEPLGVTAIAAALGTLPGTAYRSLDALERGDFVTRYRASTLYQIGATAVRLRQTLHAQFPLRNLATPFLRRLALAANDTVSLVVPVGWQGLRLVVIAGSNSVRSNVATGLSGLLENSLAGRQILAGMESGELAAYLAGRVEHAERDLSPISTDMLDEIAQRGHALEPIEGSAAAAVAMPLRHRGKVIAAVSIDGPVVRHAASDDLSDLEAWKAIVAEIEHTIAQTPAFTATPFAHLDPAEVDRALYPSFDEDDDD